MDRRELLALLATVPYVRVLTEVPEVKYYNDCEPPGYMLGPGMLSFTARDGTQVEIGHVDEFRIITDYEQRGTTEALEVVDPKYYIETILHCGFE